MIRLAFCLAILASVVGCLPSTRVHKHPSDDDQGVRFYRPKPYLFVKPMVDKSGQPVNGFVTLETVMMPDFGEEYSIHVRPGLGSNETKIVLADGWRLEGLNVDVDANVDDNLEAIAELVSVVPRLTASANDVGAMAVRATNVPLGYYESIVSSGHDGKKRLYGFRYVGFMPYSPCPIESCGLECQSCYQTEIYGLVFEDAAMVFRPLHDAVDHLTKPSEHVDREELVEPELIRLAE